MEPLQLRSGHAHTRRPLSHHGLHPRNVATERATILGLSNEKPLTRPSWDSDTDRDRDTPRERHRTKDFVWKPSKNTESRAPYHRQGAPNNPLETI